MDFCTIDFLSEQLFLIDGLRQHIIIIYANDISLLQYTYSTSSYMVWLAGKYLVVERYVLIQFTMHKKMLHHNNLYK